MQQLDLFGFPIEQPAPKKKEKAVKANDVQPMQEQAETKSAAPVPPVVEQEQIVTQEEIISIPTVLPVEEEKTVVVEEIIPVVVEEIIEVTPVAVTPVVEEKTIAAPAEEKVFVAPTVVETPATPVPASTVIEQKILAKPSAEKIFAAPTVVETPAATTIAGVVAKEKTATKKTTAPEVKQAGKRGRKSFKEMDNEADLIEVPADEILHQKLYYSISEVAGWFKVNTSLLRYWENEFDVLQPRKTRKGDRLFRVEDIKNLQLIYFLLRQRKFSIDGAKNYLKNNKQEADTQIRLVESLTRFKSFLLEMKANLQA